jgi:RHS repeat-associated protein
MYFGGRLLAPVDRLGSVRSNQNGNIAYFPWGEERTSTPDGTDKFGTYFRDATNNGIGEDYASARYYNNNFGRFWSPDPAGLKAAKRGNPTSWNRYAYANDDPVNGIDPSGLCVIDGTEYEDGGPECPNVTSVGVTATADPVDTCDGGVACTGFTLTQPPTAPCSNPSGACGMGAPVGVTGQPGGSAHAPDSQTGPPGYAGALSLLKVASPQCQKDIDAGSAAQAATELANSTINYVWGAVPEIDAAGNTVNAASEGAVPASTEGTTININLNYGYMTPADVSVTTTSGGFGSINELQAMANVFQVASVSVAQYQELVLIHEIGHMLGVPQEKSQQYNISIFNDCIQ